MDDLETQIAQLRAKHAKDLAQKERELTMRAAITAELGLDDAAWTPGFVHTAYADCFIVLKAETLPDAILMAERMNPETLAKVKNGGSTSILTLERWEAKGSKGDCELICPYVYEVERLVMHHPETRTLRFYVKAAGYTVEVRVMVAKDPDTHIDYVVLRRSREGDVREVRRELVNKSGHFPRVVRWWSSLESPGRFTLYSN